MDVFLEQFTSYGAPYLLLGAAIWWIRILSGKLEESQEKRIADNQRSSDMHHEMTTALDALSDLIRSLRTRR